MSSVHDAMPSAGRAHYAASKAGVLMLMKTMALELAAHKVRVNTISPGVINTPTNRMAWKSPEKETGLLELIPYGRLGQCGDVARIAMRLASDDSGYVTGTTIYVHGGMTLRPGFQEGG